MLNQQQAFLSKRTGAVNNLQLVNGLVVTCLSMRSIKSIRLGGLSQAIMGTNLNPTVSFCVG